MKIISVNSLLFFKKKIAYCKFGLVIEQSKIIDIYDLENEKQNLNLKLNKINKIIQSNEFQLENINKQ